MHRPLNFESPLQGLIMAAIVTIIFLIVLLYEHYTKSKKKYELDKVQLKIKLFSLSNKISTKKTDRDMDIILHDVKQALQAYKRYQKRQFWRNVREIVKDGFSCCTEPYPANTLTELRSEVQAKQGHGTDNQKPRCKNGGNCETCFRRIRLFF